MKDSCANKNKMGCFPLFALAASALTGGAQTTLGRRALLSSAAAAAVAPLQAAQAFNLPPLSEFDNPKARAAASKQANPPLSEQQSAAFYAVSTGDQASLKLMVDGGWDLASAKDTAGKTVLHRAAQVGNAAAVETLLKAGSEVDAVTQWKETPLHMATRQGRLECVKLLTAAGAKVDKQTIGGDTPLVLAKKYRMKAVEDYLASL